MIDAFGVLLALIFVVFALTVFFVFAALLWAISPLLAVVGVLIAGGLLAGLAAEILL